MHVVVGELGQRERRFSMSREVGGGCKEVRPIGLWTEGGKGTENGEGFGV